jgi:hypothetical protein
MKPLFTCIIAFYTALGGSLTAQNQCAPDINTSLFNGKDLKNWVFCLKDQTVDPHTVFMVKDAAIHITGSPFGYMRTKEQYSDYKLHVEWRWPVEATNSGVFIHAQQVDTIWPACFECQLKSGNAGDFICMGGTDMNERADKSSIVVPRKQPSNEKPVGDWNEMDVVCKGNTIEVYINGTLQNRATGTSLSTGSVCLQSEGKAVEFRNLYLTKL